MRSEEWVTRDFGSSRKPVKPFLKWAGGKSQLLEPLLRALPTLEEGKRYFEPFLGAGAVFFALRPKRAVISDINRPLVETYLTVRDRLQALLSQLSGLPSKPSRDDYYVLREDYNQLIPELGRLSSEELTRLSALFVWLNHTCYNGLYRVNRLGLFNVPFSSAKEPTIFDESTLKTASKALSSRKVEILASDYRQVLSRAGEGDVIYLDPPYDPLTDTSRFTSYTQEDFGSFDQEALATEIRALINRGCRVVMTNSVTPRTLRIFGTFQTQRIEARRAINCKGEGRGKVKELLVIA